MDYRLILVMGVLLYADVSAATYKGKSVDGVTYACSIKMNREIIPCFVQFDGKGASVELPKGIFDVRLASEIIDNPKEVEGYLGEQSIVMDVDLPD